MVLVTGPTGSGKTTTLYAALNEIKSEEDKIITIEDPVEYQIRGITQIPVNEKKGLTFARGLRSILRHDPDKILVGEIRDAETAQIAINSALTGHLVFTTVHANNVVDVLGRFLNMGVEPYNFVSALNCILAQRLVRQVCEFCVQDVHLHRRRTASKTASSLIRVARRCLQGRPGLHRVRRHRLPRPLRHPRAAGAGRRNPRDAAAEKRPGSEIRKKAKDKGMAFLRDSALERVRAGVTTSAKRSTRSHLSRLAGSARRQASSRVASSEQCDSPFDAGCPTALHRCCQDIVLRRHSLPGDY